MIGLQTMARVIFPPECLNCAARVEAPFGLCGGCWSETPFILGAACDACGMPLAGQMPPSPEAERLTCDACLALPRPWDRGRAVLSYDGVGRSLVLALKHGDRADVARAAGPWMARVAADLVTPGALVVPIPLHWRRLVKRRFNQAALLAQTFAHEAGLPVAPQALHRPRATGSQDGRGKLARFANVDGALVPHPRHGAALQGAWVILVDDVMTSGATFTAATEACLEAGAEKVSVLALARVAQDV